MLKNMRDPQHYYDILYSVKYKFNDYYELSYLTQETYNRQMDALSGLRSLGEIDGNCYHIISKIFKHSYNNERKIKELNRQQPRLIAQKFIGKKNVREFIFKRDEFRCLCCGS